MTVSRLCSMLCCSPPHPRPPANANVGSRIFMVASQGLGFEEIRPARNALRTPNPFLRPGEWESGLRGQVGKKEILGLISIIFREGY